jgi:1,4-dihydroxy-2-naphthoate octaprenyltransferase
MRAVSISQLWSRAWDLFKVNWLLLLGLLVLYVIVSLIPIIGNLIALILLWPALVRAGYLVARQGQSSFGEAFRDISLLLKVFVYLFILLLIPGILIGLWGYCSWSSCDLRGDLHGGGE